MTPDESTMPLPPEGTTCGSRTYSRIGSRETQERNVMFQNDADSTDIRPWCDIVAENNKRRGYRPAPLPSLADILIPYTRLNGPNGRSFQ